MKLNAKKFGLAAGGAFAVLWGVCSLLVLIMPSSMMALEKIGMGEERSREEAEV